MNRRREGSAWAGKVEGVRGEVRVSKSFSFWESSRFVSLSSQGWGGFARCIRLWTESWLHWRNLAPQSLHLKGFSPVCVYLCSL